MELQIQAIFENGVFKPLTEVAPPEHQRVVLKVENGEASEGTHENETVAQQKRAMEELDAEVDRLPDNSPDDGFSSEDHDRVLYGADGPSSL